MSRILKTALVALAGIALPSAALTTAANAGCSGNVCYNQTSSLPSLGSWSGSTSQRFSSATQYSTSAPTYSFSGSTSTVSGLGPNESLRATSCPVNVYNPNQGQVLGCYNVVKPVPQTTYYRVVRPVVYVRYPVPVAVPYPVYGHGAYGHGGYGHGHGYHHGQYGGGCQGAVSASRYGGQSGHKSKSRYGSPCG